MNKRWICARDRNILRSLPLEDVACVALFCFFAMQGAIPFIAPAQALEATAATPSGLTIVGGIAAQAIANTVILGLILRRPRLLQRSITGLPWLLVPAALAGLAIVSAAWSLDPLFTLRRSLPFALAGLFGVWFSVRYSLDRQLAILRLAMILLALATIALVALDPGRGLDHSAGHAADWQGVFTQKNACGRIMVLATAIIFCEGRRTMLRPSRLTALALFLFVLVMSGSRGAWMIETALVLLWMLIAFAQSAGQRLRLILGLAAPLTAAVTGAFFFLSFRFIAPFLGRDLTLTGRIAIWEQVARFIPQRPFLGYGYDAFWRGMQGPSLQVASAVHFVVAHAHNGFLEIALELGAVGLALFFISWLRGWVALWLLWQRSDPDWLVWPLTILFLIALYDLDENTLLIYNGLFWILYVSALAGIEAGRQPAVARLRHAPRTSERHHTAAFRPREILKSNPRRAQHLAGVTQEIP